MKIDIDGLPLVGKGSMMLGVRPTDPTLTNKRSDVPAILATDLVRPGDGGLSCYDDPAAIKIQSNTLVLWSIETDKLPATLIAQVAGKAHYHIEPKSDVALDELQQRFAETRDHWYREERGDGT